MTSLTFVAQGVGYAVVSANTLTVDIRIVRCLALRIEVGLGRCGALPKGIFGRYRCIS